MDVGAAKGHLMAALKDQRADLTITINDLSQSKCEWAESHYGFPTICGATADLSTCRERFDVVTANDLLYYEPSISTLWSPLTFLLKPQGKLILGVPNKLLPLLLHELLLNTITGPSSRRMRTRIRHFNPEQIFHEFELDRTRLFSGFAGGVHSKNDLFLLFSSHGDVFEGSHGPELQATIPDICKACHSEDPLSSNSGNTQTILSYSRFRFPLPDNQKPILFATTWDNEAQIVIEWKIKHNTWQSLEALWHPLQ